jgi:hypothetical protein
MNDMKTAWGCETRQGSLYFAERDENELPGFAVFREYHTKDWIPGGSNHKRACQKFYDTLFKIEARALLHLFEDARA